jgi:hypothetical protein
VVGPLDHGEGQGFARWLRDAHVQAALTSHPPRDPNDPDFRVTK